jgi:hypothetical protein
LSRRIGLTEIWAKFARQISDGSRTDVLRALVWPNALLLFSLVGLGSRGAPTWLLILVACLLIFFMFLYGAAYIYFGFKDPNLLRSERYNIEKLAIERGISGDSVKGVIEYTSDVKEISYNSQAVEKKK